MNGKISYLVGTLHSTELSLQNFDDSLVRALHRSEVLFVEPILSGNQSGGHKEQSLSLSNPIFPLVSTGAQDRLKAFVNKYGLLYSNKRDRIVFLRSMTPGSIIKLIYEVSSHHYLSPKSEKQRSDVQIFDERIVTEAQSRGLELRGLDAPSVRAAVFETAAPEAKEFNKLVLEILKKNGELTSKGIEWISKTVNSMDHWNNKPPREILENYLAGELIEMNPSPRSTLTERFASNYLLALLNRHQHWVDRIVSSMSSKPTFVAVGVAHVAGVNGSLEGKADTLLTSLENRGAKITRIEQTNHVPSLSRSPEKRERHLRCLNFL